MENWSVAFCDGSQNPDDCSHASILRCDLLITHGASHGYPLVMKLNSPDITHKTEAGGIRQDLRSDADVRAAFAGIVESARRYDPDTLSIAEKQGFKTVHGLVLYDNKNMLALGKKMGFDIKNGPDSGCKLVIHFRGSGHDAN
jgi:hypothetical protein